MPTTVPLGTCNQQDTSWYSSSTGLETSALLDMATLSSVPLRHTWRLASTRAEAGKTFKEITLTAQVAPLTDNLFILPLASVVTRTQSPVSPSLLRHLLPGTHPILRHVVASETRGPSGTLNVARLGSGWKQSRTPSPPYLVCVISRLQARYPMAWTDQRRLSSRRMRGRKPSSSLGGLPLGLWGCVCVCACVVVSVVSQPQLMSRANIALESCRHKRVPRRARQMLAFNEKRGKKQQGHWGYMQGLVPSHRSRHSDQLPSLIAVMRSIIPDR
ncbi:hypothetical protein BDP55DRAFT_371623 [Colletotrichum godetiae]|uniref:Uncharacterized protein n=1 Tax=Colletotrichum godetiae TaxID=1209918 RepID=A0AAJ0AAG1_9PEZI|nr:uncharacterized protein BDP55DRAFT_371623 [Colletotrichum godetiae]KAK1658919.1 hypothetical protein BDP55DRAFT_371623 [Colletotrichum godetiae]